MGRSDKKARKALKVKQTLDILRDRDRKTSSLRQLVPPDSEATPARILRNNIDSYQLPAFPPPDQSMPKRETKKERLLRKQDDRIARRVQLMSTISTDVFDLTHIDPDIDTDESVCDVKLHSLYNDDRAFNLFFSVGFGGYSRQSTSQRRKVTLQRIQSPPHFQRSVLGVVQYQTAKLGLSKQDIEVLGYEVLVPEDLSCHDVTIPAGKRVLVRSSNILVAWAEQVKNQNPEVVHEVVVRIVKNDGSMFDPAYRTREEIMATLISPNDSIEPGMQDDRPMSSSTQMLSKSRRKQARKEATGGSTRKGVRFDTLARREKLAAKANLRLDTLLIESMMARQQLSGGSTDKSTTRASSLPIDASQQNEGGRNIGNDLKQVEAGIMELEMVE